MQIGPVEQSDGPDKILPLFKNIYDDYEFFKYIKVKRIYPVA